MKAFTKHAARLFSALDFRDLHIYGGLGLLGYGFYLVLGDWAYAIVGGVLFAMGVLLMRGSE